MHLFVKIGIVDCGESKTLLLNLIIIGTSLQDHQMMDKTQFEMGTGSFYLMDQYQNVWSWAGSWAFLIGIISHFFLCISIRIFSR